jgi:hypothetical protein
MNISVVAGVVAAFMGLAVCLASEPSIDEIQIHWGAIDFSQLPLTSPLISQLNTGETVDIRIMTRNCFGGSTYSLHVVGPPPLRVLVHGRHDAAVDGQLPLLGQSILTLSDALRVDRVIAYYRTRSQGACTTSATVSAEWKLKSGTKSESWFDDSCAIRDSDITLSLYSVA